MTDHATPGHADTADATHDAGHHDAHGHAAEALGPVDWRMWGASILGVIAALVVAACVAVATAFRFFGVSV